MEAAALRLVAADDEAASTLLALLTQLQLSPTDAKAKVLPPAGPVHRGLDHGGRELLTAVGYLPRDGFLVLGQAPRDLEGVLQALQKAIASTHKSRMAGKSRRAAAAEARGHAAWTSPEEPSSGARLTLLLGQQRIVRTFDADDTLARVVRFLASLEPSKTPDDYACDGALTWRLLQERDPPAWWCDAWRLRDDTAGRDLSADDAHKTVAALGLWPSAVVSVGPVDLGDPAPAITRPPPATKPSDLRHQVQTRFDDSPLLQNRKLHLNVAKSADATPGLADLLAMGFAEDKARAALRRADGRLERALEELLR